MAVGQFLFDFVGSECRYLVLLDTPVVASGRNLRKIPEIGCVDLSKNCLCSECW